MTDLRAQRTTGYEGERPEVQALVPRTARRILELGCSSGVLGAGLKARQGVEVVGMELDPEYAADADKRLDRVLVGDVEALLGDAELVAGLGRFDAVIAADVLEHLRDPWTALRRAMELLEPGGTVVVSVPNVRYARTLVEVFGRGRWPRDAEGVFDATHLRWFTRQDAVELLQQAGATVEHVEGRIFLLAVPGLPRFVARLLRPTPLRWLVEGQYVLQGTKR